MGIFMRMMYRVCGNHVGEDFYRIHNFRNQVMGSNNVCGNSVVEINLVEVVSVGILSPE